MAGLTKGTRGSKHYFRRKDELSLIDECVLWGNRIVIPPKLRKEICNELHQGHLGVVKMKSIARSYCWWPRMDHDIEALTKAYPGCQLNMKEPPKASLHPWEWPENVYDRIHINYAGPIDGVMYLVVVDAHSKWPEVLATKDTSSTKTISLLRSLFARYGLCKTLVSDNGSQFTSQSLKHS
ncbi:uncharacterized protein K02A2.6-like [Anneissia japonica]|uniref:uncharacterized protein K02A2.6-like n=1 Tax=Anneissia japonica TaxID=1529436 RepID=UPI0014258638|nr:uncharacterized protein K02A2.6-like [Anneissia japonica]